MSALLLLLPAMVNAVPGDATIAPSFPRKRESSGAPGDATLSPSFPRKRESSAASELDSRLRGNDEKGVLLALQDTSPPPPPPEAQPGSTPDNAMLPGRRRPGVPQHELEPPVSQDNPGALRAPPPEAFPTDRDQIPIPDRWRLIET